MVGGEGPWIGKENLRFGTPHVLIAGLNPVCTDAVGTAVMGYDPRATRGTIPFRACDNTLLLAEEQRRTEAVPTPPLVANRMPRSFPTVAPVPTPTLPSSTSADFRFRQA